MKQKKVIEKMICIKPEDRVPFHNQVDYCVGTGRMGLALQKEYMEQLSFVQETIGFQYIRGHGLFSDDMAIYHEYEENGETKVEYNFTYLDLVMDNYQSVGIKPFLELGFMPKKLASGEQTIFYWKGNTTPPKDYEKWEALVQATLKHLIERYGADEVTTWPVEVWNEPNLPGFWKDADMQEYFRLFKHSFYAVKAVDERFLVGGPAVCGGTDEKWIRSFLTFCKEEQIPLDFVSRHHYCTELPEHVGHYGYAELEEIEPRLANLHSTRTITDSFAEFEGKPIHVTEFNTSYIPNCPLHDTNQNAAYIATQLSRMGDGNASYSYWTFGDIFEEFGVPYTPFHGGFGLVANGCIPKPTFYTFAFFKKLKELEGVCVHRDENSVILQYGDVYRGVLWYTVNKRQATQVSLRVVFPTEKNEYSVVYQRVDEDTTNPLKVWHDLGEPANLTRSQKEILQLAAKPLISSERIVPSEGEVELQVELPEHSVVYFELQPSKICSDRGYCYERVMQYE